MVPELYLSKGVIYFLLSAELAEHTGLTLSYISQLESPNLPYCPSVKALFTIAKALGVKHLK